MRPILIAGGVALAISLGVGALFYFDSSDGEQVQPVLPVPQQPLHPGADGGERHPHPDRAGFRYSPPPQ